MRDGPTERRSDGATTGSDADALEALGWTAAFAAAFEPHRASGCEPARVAVEHRARFEVLGAAGARDAVISGRMRHEARSRLDRPAVGDWVVLDRQPRRSTAMITAVLPRASVFTRMAAGREREEQIVAANVDVVFIVTSLNAELNLRRLERYLTLAWESGARPVLVLSKADLAADAEARRAEVAAALAGVPIHLTSVHDGAGLAELAQYLRGHRTGALLGSSGVGKSTLINALVGFERQATGEIRERGSRGRHTTTRRELIMLPLGGLLIDTPGMRELQLSDAGHGLLAAFDDIERLAETCGFRDCTHGPEPDCAVKAAVAGGTLEAERLDSFHKLRAEMAFADRKTDPRQAAIVKARDRVANKALQKHLKKKRG